MLLIIFNSVKINNYRDYRNVTISERNEINLIGKLIFS